MEKRLLIDADYYDQIVYAVCALDDVLSTYESFYEAVDELKRSKRNGKHAVPLSIRLVKKSVQTSYYLMDDLDDFKFFYGGKINE